MSATTELTVRDVKTVPVLAPLDPPITTASGAIDAPRSSSSISKRRKASPAGRI
jgi:hypothetical protein